ncbi:MAG: hypothetical protein A2W10_08275 [Deltaproteobacteria bacterium RBG_16_55_12]|nr:MAG: hypothetical protein A2W10_08275 [Deltaproteobacteria bacterium RBG_16_55_12]
MVWRQLSKVEAGIESVGILLRCYPVKEINRAAHVAIESLRLQQEREIDAPFNQGFPLVS